MYSLFRNIIIYIYVLPLRNGFMVNHALGQNHGTT